MQLFVSFLISIAAFALSDVEIQQRVQEALADRHPTQDAAWFKALGENAPAVLMRMYEATNNTAHRIRLVEGLRAFEGNSQVSEFLRAELTKNPQSAERRSLAKSYGVQAQAAAIPVLKELLNDNDPQMRLAVALTLRDMKNADATSYVNQWKTRERQTWIVQTVEKEDVLIKPLAIVSTSEEATPMKLKGEWKGYIVYLDKKDLTSFPATLSISEKDGKLIASSLTWKDKAKKRAAAISFQGAHGEKATGKFEKEFQGGFEITLKETGAEPQVWLHSDAQGISFLGVKR